MSKINVLDKLTIDQIAAGEVVERPASVVKELVENSIDANATAVTVEIMGGGTELIRITDNGSGIPKEEVPTAFLRHATSKLKTAEDLLSVRSLGFRGEALPSVASVAKVELITKVRGDFTGLRYLIEGGEVVKSEEIGCPDGTTIIVRELFYNTPARKKFLKTAQTEGSYISELMEHMALSHPEISFKLINKGTNSIYTTGNRNLKDVIYGVYGRDITAALVPVVGIYGSLSIDGFVAKPYVSRGNRNFENYYVNGRYIKNNVITKAIEDAYKPYTMQHRFPFTALKIEVPNEMIDVNVHPAKLEVRFADGEAVYRAVYHAVSDALSGRNLIPDALFEEKKAFEKEEAKKEVHNEEKNEPHTVDSVILPRNEQKAVSKEEMPKEEPLKEAPQKKIVQQESVAKEVLQKEAHERDAETVKESTITLLEDEKPSYKAASEVKKDVSVVQEKPCYRIIGQVFKTYWLVEWADTFYIIDQHAAHEKVIYERLVKSFSERHVESQNLLPPLVVSLNEKEEVTLKQHLKTFNEAGFEIEHFGGREYLLTAVPVDLYGLPGEDYFKDILDRLTGVSDIDVESEIPMKLATMACKAAIKGNMNISELEAKKLIEELLSLENPFNCPHGRPIIISMSKIDLEKKFKRIV